MNKITVSPNIFYTTDIHTWYLLDPYTYGSINQTHADFLGKNKQEIERNHIDTVLPEHISKSYIETNKKNFLALELLFKQKNGFLMEKITSIFCQLQKFLILEKMVKLNM
ncbi:hypothetical protein [Methanohalophilus profundi]|uniref:hypothetical protein n=1 Tax=Methanohalophilus profundi TaxID=2138083 RepID=UPI00101C7B2E|nr:hypothetical protein [Methanohalophilus profundi]